MQLIPAYRQELEENLPDQKNVALGGFCVLREGEQLPAGNYTIAVLVVNRVSKIRLLPLQQRQHPCSTCRTHLLRPVQLQPYPE